MVDPQPYVEPATAAQLRTSYELALDRLAHLVEEAGKTAARDVSSDHARALRLAKKFLEDAGRPVR